LPKHQPAPRKQRTREHVIADLSFNHFERFVLLAGYTAERVFHDYGYDLLMFTFDEKGFAEPGSVCVQLKATESLEEVAGEYVFDVELRDYNLWNVEKMPVILVLFDAKRRRAFWLSVQRYFREETTRGPRPGARTVRVRINKRQAVNRRAIARMRSEKQTVLEHFSEELWHE
jgi:hypothetical protein